MAFDNHASFGIWREFVPSLNCKKASTPLFDAAQRKNNHRHRRALFNHRRSVLFDHRRSVLFDHRRSVLFDHRPSPSHRRCFVLKEVKMETSLRYGGDSKALRIHARKKFESTPTPSSSLVRIPLESLLFLMVALVWQQELVILWD